MSDLAFSKILPLKRGSPFEREGIRLFSGLNRTIKRVIGNHSLLMAVQAGESANINSSRRLTFFDVFHLHQEKETRAGAETLMFLLRAFYRMQDQIPEHHTVSERTHAEVSQGAKRPWSVLPPGGRTMYSEWYFSSFILVTSLQHLSWKNISTHHSSHGKKKKNLQHSPFHLQCTYKQEWSVTRLDYFCLSCCNENINKMGIKL